MFFYYIFIIFPKKIQLHRSVIFISLIFYYSFCSYFELDFIFIFGAETIFVFTQKLLVNYKINYKVTASNTLN